MSSPASVARHPIHPMLVMFPIGLWVFSLVCDLIHLYVKDPVWLTVSLYSMTGGLIGALVAAIPGFIDLFSMPPSKTKKIGIWHMSLNLVIVLLFAVNLAVRYSKTGPGEMAIPLALSIVAVALLTVSGWLGGEMVYVQGMGVDEHALEHEHAGTPAHQH